MAASGRQGASAVERPPCWSSSRRNLARGIASLDEFHKEAVRAFGALLGTVSAQSAETFRTAAITVGGVDLEAIGLKRPTATWTYLVHENP